MGGCRVRQGDPETPRLNDPFGIRTPFYASVVGTLMFLGRTEAQDEVMAMGDKLLRRRQVEEITAWGARRSIGLCKTETSRRPYGSAPRRPVEGERHHGLVGVAAAGEKPVRPAQHILDAAGAVSPS